jgi:hypothetical protein
VIISPTRELAQQVRSNKIRPTYIDWQWSKETGERTQL